MRRPYFRDKLKRKRGVHNEVKSIILCSISKSNILSIIYKRYFLFIFGKLSVRNTLTRCHNFCYITFRSHSVYRFFGLERFCLKQKIMYGLLPGVKFRVKW